MPFISIEGCEASGKSTQTLILQQALMSSGFDAVITKEPGGTKLADHIRDMLLSNEIVDTMTEFLLLSAARRDHVLLIEKLLKKNKWVITDRFTDSSLAYQGYAKGLDLDFINFCTKVITSDMLPDLTILLDVDINIMQKRITNSPKHHNFYDDKGPEFHKKIKDGFLELAKLFPERIKVVNADDEMEIVSSNIRKIVNEKFNIKL